MANQVQLNLHCCHQQLLLVLQVGATNYHFQTEQAKGMAEILLPQLTDLLRRAKISLAEIDTLCFSNGPGGFSGIRIAVCLAQALSFSKQIALYPLSSLAILAHSFAADNQSDNIQLQILVDAKMRELYTASFFINKQKVLRETDDMLIAIEQVKPNSELTYIGDGCQLVTGLTTIQQSDNAVTVDGLNAAAKQQMVDSKPMTWQQIKPLYLRKQNAWVSNQRVIINE